MSANGKSSHIQELLEQNGIAANVLVFSESTKTAHDAAQQAGCDVGQIAKSIIFKMGNEAVLAIVSGPNRVSLPKLEKALHETDSMADQKIEKIKIEKADAAFVLEKTGFPIGGVPSFGHTMPMSHVFFDEDLMQYKTIWSAAGTPNAIYEIAPRELVRISKAQVRDIKE